jgi:hypothetical protein
LLPRGEAMATVKIAFNDLGKQGLLGWCKDHIGDDRLEVYRDYSKPWEVAIHSTKQYSKLTPLEASVEGPYFATTSR